MFSLLNKSIIFTLITFYFEMGFSCSSSTSTKAKSASLEPLLTPTVKSIIKDSCIANADAETYFQVLQNSSQHESCVEMFAEKQKLDSEIKEITWEIYIEQYCKNLSSFAGECYQYFMNNLATFCFNQNHHLHQVIKLHSVANFLETVFSNSRFNEKYLTHFRKCSKETNNFNDCRVGNPFGNQMLFEKLNKKLNSHYFRDHDKNYLTKEFCLQRDYYLNCIERSSSLCMRQVTNHYRFLADLYREKTPCRMQHKVSGRKFTQNSSKNIRPWFTNFLFIFIIIV